MHFCASGSTTPINATGLPCASIVTHTDGSTVSAAKPASAGELIVIYAVSLGQTNPPSVTGKIVTAATPGQTKFTLDFNYCPNALPSRTLPTGPQPLYAGTTPRGLIKDQCGRPASAGRDSRACRCD